MKIKTLLIIYLLTSLSTMAQFSLPSNSARSNAMGGCSIALKDYWSNMNNIAGCANLSQYSIGISYQHNYAMKGQAYKSIAITLPINSIGTILTSYTHYGNLTYNEQYVALGYAMNINPKIALGITIDYIHSGTSDIYYKSINALTCAIGLHIYPTDNITIGSKIYNPIFLKLPTENITHIPTIFNIGISYLFIEKLLGTLEFEKNIFCPITLRIGLEYNINKFIFARMGYNTHPNNFSFGLGIRQKQYSIDISTQVHPTLGFTPSISTHFSF